MSKDQSLAADHHQARNTRKAVLAECLRRNCGPTFERGRLCCVGRNLCLGIFAERRGLAATEEACADAAPILPERQGGNYADHQEEQRRVRPPVHALLLRFNAHTL